MWIAKRAERQNLPSDTTTLYRSKWELGSFWMDNTCKIGKSKRSPVVSRRHAPSVKLTIFRVYNFNCFEKEEYSHNIYPTGIKLMINQSKNCKRKIGIIFFLVGQVHKIVVHIYWANLVLLNRCSPFTALFLANNSAMEG